MRNCGNGKYNGIIFAREHFTGNFCSTWNILHHRQYILIGKLGLCRTVQCKCKEMCGAFYHLVNISRRDHHIRQMLVGGRACDAVNDTVHINDSGNPHGNNRYSESITGKLLAAVLNARNRAICRCRRAVWSCRDGKYRCRQEHLLQ